MGRAIDIEELRVSSENRLASGSSKQSRRSGGGGRKPKTKRSALFLKGPVPLSWLGKAAALPGKGTAWVALALWFKSGLENDSRTVKLTQKDVRHFAVSRWAKSRGLDRLEKAGLISVERRIGKSPVVTILGVSKGWNRLD